MEDRNAGFIIHEEDLQKTQRLSDGDFRSWVTACVHYCSSGEMPDGQSMSALSLAIFDFTTPRMNEYLQRWDRRVAANRENGKKGGRPRKQASPERETQTNPENPVGFLETHRTPENPVAPNTNTNTRTSTITIAKSTLEEERIPEEIEGCGGKEKPKPELQKLQSSDRDENHDPEITVEVDYSSGNYYEVQNVHRRVMSPFEVEQYTQELKRRAMEKLNSAGGITND